VNWFWIESCCGLLLRLYWIFVFHTREFLENLNVCWIFLGILNNVVHAVSAVSAVEAPYCGMINYVMIINGELKMVSKNARY
jgi:hypothetical protein